MTPEELYGRQRQEMVKALARIEKAEAEVARVRAQVAEEIAVRLETYDLPGSESQWTRTGHKWLHRAAAIVREHTEAPDAP